MPAIKKVPLPTGFTALEEDRREKGELGTGRTRDCTVVAMTIVTGLPYATCHEALKAAGRRDRTGTYKHQQQLAYESLGYVWREWTSHEVVDLISSYPKKGIAGLTTHQPRRFPKAWAPHSHKALLLYSRGHVSAYCDGVVQDWAINRAKQIYLVVEITKKEEA
jgi:hypothetical protein